MTRPDEIKPNFILVDQPAPRDPAAEALAAVTLDTPAREISSDQMKDFQRLFARQFGEF